MQETVSRAGVQMEGNSAAGRRRQQDKVDVVRMVGRGGAEREEGDGCCRYSEGEKSSTLRLGSLHTVLLPRHLSPSLCNRPI